MTREEELEVILTGMLSLCERLKQEHEDIWDKRNPTIHYLQRNMDRARKLLPPTK